MAQILADLVW